MNKLSSCLKLVKVAKYFMSFDKGKMGWIATSGILLVQFFATWPMANNL